jgi:hypothetical protein
MTMGCCGQSRADYAPAFAPPPARAAQPAGEAAAPGVAAADAPGTVRLRFTRETGVRVRGPVSGLAYAFSGDAPVQPVDARDADNLLRTGYFRRAF